MVNNGRIREVVKDMSDNMILPKTFVLGNGDNSMKIEKMIIRDICGIRLMTIHFNKGLNLICGENGIGKTTILKAISYQFLYGHDSFIKKRYGTEKGSVEIWLDTKKEHLSYEVTNFVPGYIDRYCNDVQRGNNVLYFSPMRVINYEKIAALPPSKNIQTDNNSIYSSQLLASGVENNIKNWFINQYLFSKIEHSLSEIERYNLDLSIKLFGLLDKNLSVFTVKSDYEIVLKNNNDEIYFEMLSDGYKSCVFVLLGIIKEIEYRFPQKKAIDFDGVIMIDEIDIHLHPQWQAKLVKVLKETFPNAQIIATTHSPSVLQNATAEEIIPLYKDENGDVHIKELHLGEYGLQGWTLEEIMKDVMGMESTTSDLYTETIHKFDLAMNNEDQTEILKNYKMLKQMLHPESTMLQLLEIQVSEWKN